MRPDADARRRGRLYEMARSVIAAQFEAQQREASRRAASDGLLDALDAEAIRMIDAAAPASRWSRWRHRLLAFAPAGLRRVRSWLR